MFDTVKDDNKEARQFFKYRDNETEQESHQSSPSITLNTRGNSAELALIQRMEGKREPNNTGIPDDMKEKFEGLSGFSFDDVKVHYNSDKPAQLQALAYTQGNQVYVGPGQEEHLGHELGHVVQQKEGRVRATTSVDSAAVNDDVGLENEADMFSDVAQEARLTKVPKEDGKPLQMRANGDVIQRAIGFEFQTGWEVSKSSGIFSWKRLDKGERFLGDNNVSVEADDHIGDKSAIEFVTKPMNSLAEVQQSLFTINDHARYLNTIKNETTDISGKKIKISASGPMTATPQASFGMTLNQLYAIDNFNVEVHRKREADKDGKIDGITILRDSMDECNPLPDSDLHTRGVVRLISRYINRGQARKSFDYPKQIADGFTLARTDFGKLLEVALTQDRIKIADFSIEVWLGLFESSLGKNLFAHEVKSDADAEPLKAGESKASDLTIKEWLSDIYRKGTSDYGAGECTMETSLLPKDKLSKVKTHEGLGALGDKTETVAGKEGGIFESRLHYPSPLPLEKWGDYATLWTRFVAKMSGADVNDLSKKAPTVQPSPPTHPASEHKDAK